MIQTKSPPENPARFIGLDHCEARSWDGWHRHMTLCMAALAFLARLRAELERAAASKPNERNPDAVAAAA